MKIDLSYIVFSLFLISAIGCTGSKNVLLEGGGITNWTFVKENLVDDIIITVTPYLVGGGTSTTLVDGTGFSKIVGSTRLKLKNVRIGNAVRCVPPQNKPLNEEILNCRPYLVQEINMMNNLRFVLALGGIAHRQIIHCIDEKQNKFKNNVRR